MSHSVTVGERGKYRVRMEVDESPSKPYDESGCPIICVDNDGYGTRFTDAGYTNSDPLGAVNVLGRFTHAHGWRQAIEVFERYVRIFHEGTVETYNLGVSREYGYLAYTTRALARAWGIPDEEPVPPAELTEWTAWVEGDVWGWIVEERVMTWERASDVDDPDLPTLRTTWEEVESCWGFYGSTYAAQAALQALEDFAPSTPEPVE